MRSTIVCRGQGIWFGVRGLRLSTYHNTHGKPCHGGKSPLVQSAGGCLRPNLRHVS